MTRVYTAHDSQEPRDALQRLLDATSEPSAYQAAMVSLGGVLGQELVIALADARHVLLICTVEDADFLACGLIEQIEPQCDAQFHVTCFWNERINLSDAELAPIINRYDEPIVWDELDAVIIVKSTVCDQGVVAVRLSSCTARQLPVARLMRPSWDDSERSSSRSTSGQSIPACAWFQSQKFGRALAAAHGTELGELCGAWRRST